MALIGIEIGRSVIIQGMTILAPVTVPNTDGIDPGILMSYHFDPGYIYINMSFC